MSTPSQPTPTGATPAPGKLVRVRAGDVQIGMFVSELDRPWLETPFLFQGFVVSSESELETLRQHCEHVQIDAGLSEPQGRRALDVLLGKTAVQAPPHLWEQGGGRGGEAGAAAAPRPRQPAGPAVAAAQPAKAPAPAPTRLAPRADAQVSRETRTRFRSLLQSSGIAEPEEESVAKRAISKLRSLLRPSGDSELGAPTVAIGPPRLPEELAALLPQGCALRPYPDAHGVATELPRARQVMSACEDALERIAAEVRSGSPVRVDALAPVIDGLVASMVANPDALAWAVRIREENPQGQQIALKVAVLMIAIGRQMGLPTELLLQLALTGLLADIGKARLPRALLDKPGQLEPAEYRVAKRHVQLGLDLLSRGPKLPQPVLDGIAQHHERLDGSGYPNGLRGDRIGLLGRIAGIADSYAAISAPRAYANPISPQDALMGLFQWSVNLYDRSLVEQFIRSIGVFPVGSLVELSSGEVAIVLSLDRTRRLEPRLLLLTRPDKRPLPEPYELRRGAGGSDDLAPRVVSGLPSGAFGLRIREHYLEGG